MSLVPASDGSPAPRSNPVPGSRVFTPDEIKVIRELVAPKATAAELKLFLLRCKATGLDPLAKQIYAIHRYDRSAGEDKMTIQVSIDGERLIAERTGLYEGRLGPYFAGADGVWRIGPNNVPLPWLDDEPPTAALCGVWKKGNREPVWSVALWKEYAQTNRSDGSPQGLWGKMPAVMLGKCAESAALRATFPALLSGLYSEEEMPSPSASEPPTGGGGGGVDSPSSSPPATNGAAVPSEPAYNADVVDVPAAPLNEPDDEEGFFDQVEPDADAPAPPSGVDPLTGEKQERRPPARILDPENRLAMKVTQLLADAKDDDWRHDFYEAVTGKRSGKEMTSAERDRVGDWAEKVAAGEYVVRGYRPDGKLDVRQKPKEAAGVGAKPAYTPGEERDDYPEGEEPF